MFYGVFKELLLGVLLLTAATDLGFYYSQTGSGR